MIGVASLELLNGGVPRHRRAIQLQTGILSWMAHIGRVLGLLTLYRGGPSSIFGCFLLLGLLMEDHLSLLGNLLLLLLPFLLQVGDRE